MAVSYKKLFKLLIDRDMKKKDFKELTGISQGTLNKLTFLYYNNGLAADQPSEQA